MTGAAKFDGLAEGYSRRTYADADRIYDRRTGLVLALGARLEHGDRVLDLGCGDGAFGSFLLAAGLDYSGVDASSRMVQAAAARVGEERVALGDFTTYRPAVDVAAATCFNAIKYADDLDGFFRHVSGYTTTKFVFDLNPREMDVDRVHAAAAAAGFESVVVRPFFTPQSRRPPSLAVPLLKAAEGIQPLARLVLRSRFTVVAAASKRP